MSEKLKLQAAVHLSNGEVDTTNNVFPRIENGFIVFIFGINSISYPTTSVFKMFLTYTCPVCSNDTFDVTYIHDEEHTCAPAVEEYKCKKCGREGLHK